MDKILGPVFGTVLLFVTAFIFVKRSKVAVWYKKSFFNLGSNELWEKLIIIATPIGIIFSLFLISYGFK